MRYASLHDLIRHSRSSRAFFLAQPVAMQMALHKQNDYIHSAAELHSYIRALERYEHAVQISEILFKK